MVTVEWYWIFGFFLFMFVSGCMLGLLFRVRRRRYTLDDLGPMLRKQREKRGITQKLAGEEAGLKRAAFGSFERGTEPHSIEDLRKVCSWLGIQPKEVV